MLVKPVSHENDSTMGEAAILKINLRRQKNQQFHKLFLHLIREKYKKKDQKSVGKRQLLILNSTLRRFPRKGHA